MNTYGSIPEIPAYVTTAGLRAVVNLDSTEAVRIEYYTAEQICAAVFLWGSF